MKEFLLAVDSVYHIYHIQHTKRFSSIPKSISDGTTARHSSNASNWLSATKQALVAWIFFRAGDEAIGVSDIRLAVSTQTNQIIEQRFYNWIPNRIAVPESSRTGRDGPAASHSLSLVSNLLAFGRSLILFCKATDASDRPSCKEDVSSALGKFGSVSRTRRLSSGRTKSDSVQLCAFDKNTDAVKSVARKRSW